MAASTERIEFPDGGEGAARLVPGRASLPAALRTESLRLLDGEPRRIEIANNSQEFTCVN